jgi:dTDP-4-dehydrorhamnose reductase
MARRFFLIRTCGLWAAPDRAGKAWRNFVEIMLAKAKNGDAIRLSTIKRDTYANLELARQLSVLSETTRNRALSRHMRGAVHVFEFAAAIFEIAGVHANLTPTTSALYKTPQGGPHIPFSKTPD